MKDYYYILGVNRDASKQEIKKAYWKLSKKFHPDHNDGDKFFEERFKDINEAYETLIDDSKRNIYNLKFQNNPNQSFDSYYSNTRKDYSTNKNKENKNESSNSNKTKAEEFKKNDSNEDSKNKQESTADNKDDFAADDLKNKQSTNSKKENPIQSNRDILTKKDLQNIWAFLGIGFIVFAFLYHPTTTPKANQTPNYNDYHINRDLEQSIDQKLPTLPPEEKPKSLISDSFINKSFQVELNKIKTKHTKHFFTLNSSMEEVRSIQGVPTSIRGYGNSEVWYYGLSSVDFVNGKLKSYSNLDRNLRIRMKESQNLNSEEFENSSQEKPATFYTIGSSKDLVLKIQGTPTSISGYGNSEVWYYGLSSVDFVNGKLKSYSNLDENLHIRMKVSPNLVPEEIENSYPDGHNAKEKPTKFYTIGSSKELVLRIQGTPKSISGYGNSEVWYYGLSSLDFVNGKLKSYSNLDNNLHIHLNN